MQSQLGSLALQRDDRIHMAYMPPRITDSGGGLSLDVGSGIGAFVQPCGEVLFQVRKNVYYASNEVRKSVHYDLNEVRKSVRYAPNEVRKSVIFILPYVAQTNITNMPLYSVCLL